MQKVIRDDEKKKYKTKVYKSMQRIFVHVAIFFLSHPNQCDQMKFLSPTI